MSHRAFGAHLTLGRSRNRPGYAIAVIAVVLLGLASRRYDGPWSDLFGKYPGDVLWAAMVFFGLGTLRVRASTFGIATAAVATCFLVEALKLYQAPWIVDLRHTTLGHLVFGHGFSWQNLPAYAVGVVAAVAVEVAWPFGGRAGRAPRSVRAWAGLIGSVRCPLARTSAPAARPREGPGPNTARLLRPRGDVLAVLLRNRSS